jgi:hypothetical protein
MIMNTGTIAPPLRFKAGFSFGKAKDNMDGSIRIGMEISKLNSRQVFNFIKMIFSDNKIQISKIMGAILAIFLILISMFQNYDLVFNQYASLFLARAWNTTEIGNVIKEFVEKGNNPDNAFVVPYPHWVDTRLVGINAGFPRVDYALWPDKFESTLIKRGEKIYILNPQDKKSLDALKLLYPQAEEEFYYSKTPGKNFIIVSVKT